MSDHPLSWIPLKDCSEGCWGKQGTQEHSMMSPVVWHVPSHKQQGLACLEA